MYLPAVCNIDLQTAASLPYALFVVSKALDTPYLSFGQPRTTFLPRQTAVGGVSVAQLVGIFRSLSLRPGGRPATRWVLYEAGRVANSTSKF